MTNQNSCVLAFDFGASSGRAILGRFDGKTISLEEVHRFSNDPVAFNGTLYWDTLRQFFEIKQGLMKAAQIASFESVGIDTWGVDFGLLDKDGYLLEMPAHYRDGRTEGMDALFDKRLGEGVLYKRTGIASMFFNTVYQLVSLAEKRPELLRRAETALLMPDLFAYFLCGVKGSEYSIASTTSLMDPRTKAWVAEIFRQAGVSEKLFPAVVPAGSVAGPMLPELADELHMRPVPVIRVASHDTASAVVSVPASEKDYIYISSGTWSLMGVEADEPLMDEASRKMNFTNEGGYGGKIRYLKNIMGLWLIQETRRQFRRDGKDLSYADMERAALAKSAFRCFIDADELIFAPPGNMPERIRQRCRETGQFVPEDEGDVVRCIYESLAMKYRVTKEKIERLRGKSYGYLHVVGGGTKDGLLCQFTANACGVPVIAGPIEATATGNIAVQLLSLGAIKDLADARRIIAASFETKSYEPKNQTSWDEAYARYRKLFPDA